ncbi:IS66 family insertion sequence element accessory protein TnpA [Myxococcus eversor]|uniref:IS66 family insertion sequence element accessory protein TnpA n=1 Tax=Myxococcus eversor TaxID=2709661 RepID=UPI003B82E065
MRRPNPDEWTQLVEEFEASELTQKEFADRHQVSLGAFQYWLYKKSPATPVRRSETGGSPRAAFLPKVKILSWDAGGFVLTYKRLEQGRFRLPAFAKDALGAQLDATQLSMLLDGIDVTHVRRPGKWAPPPVAEAMPVSGGLVLPERWQRSPRRTSASGVSEPRSSSGRTSPSKSAWAASNPSSPSSSGPSLERRARSSPRRGRVAKVLRGRAQAA